MDETSFKGIIRILIVASWLAAVVGWGQNLWKVAANINTLSTKEVAVRVVGVPVFPLGAVVGYIDTGTIQ